MPSGGRVCGYPITVRCGDIRCTSALPMTEAMCLWPVLLYLTPHVTFIFVRSRTIQKGPLP